MVIVNIIFVISFIGFAYVNLNDKDAYLWGPIYLAAALSCALSIFGIEYVYVNLALVAFYIGYAIKLFFEKDGFLDWIRKYKTPSIVASMQATKPYIEKTREFFGLLIVAGALLLNYYV